MSIPGHLVFAIEEWLQERFRQACDGYRGEETRAAVAELFRLHDALANGSLTPEQTAELADVAADWLQPLWPTNLKDADEVARLLAATRGLLELRDRARAVAHEATARHAKGAVLGTACSASVRAPVAVAPDLLEILRLQTLLVLEANHEPFEEVRDLPPSELLDVASIFRDAIAVLDTIGWLEAEETEAMDVSITPGHVAQLRRRRAEIAMTILDPRAPHRPRRHRPSRRGHRR